MATKKPKIIHITTSEAKRYSKGVTRGVGLGRRTIGKTMVGVGLAGSFSRGGRVNPIGLGVAAAGAAIYAHGKYRQIKVRRQVNASLHGDNHKIHLFGINKKGNPVTKTIQLKVNDRIATANRDKYAAKQRLAREKSRGGHMSRSSAARVAANARWHGGGKGKK